MNLSSHSLPSPARAIFREALVARKGLFAQAALGALLINVLALATAFYSMQVYDRVIPTQGTSTLIVLTIGVLIAAVFEFIVKLARSHLLETAVKGMDLDLSQAIFRRLLGIRLDQFPASVGTLSSQVKSYETIRAFLSSATLYLAVDAPFAILFLCVILLLSGPVLAMIPAIFFALAVTVGLYYRRGIARHAESGFAAANRKLGLLVETVESAEAIKAMGAGDRQSDRWNALSLRTVEDDMAIRRFSESAAYWSALIQQVSYILLIAAGAWIAATSTDLTMGGLIACSILSGRVLGPVAALPGLVVQWAHAKAALTALEKVFALQSDNHGVDRPLMPEVLRGELRIENSLRFSWPGRPAPLAIDRLAIRAGEKVAIIGPVGAGKSTLLKLLAGLHAPQQGQVLLDGLDIQQIARTHLARRIGYLPQEVKLLSGPLRDHLAAGLENVGETEMLEACRITSLAQLVAAHPRGLDLPIGEGGTGVSGGQRQQIALTRLLLGKPDIWLLDEPTAAMDESAERRAIAAFAKAIAPRQTLVLVTHKPALLGLVERILLLAPTGIVMDGPRDDVLTRLRQGS